jgi:hypothetical protein
MIPSLTIRRPAAPLSTLSKIFTRSWWPAPSDLGAERDLSFDSIIVVWQTVGVNQVSGRTEELSPEAGGLGYFPGLHTYATAHVFGGNLFGFGRNLLKHEWGHGILFYYNSTGASPKPAVDNHISENRYVQCITGTPYLLVDESAQEIPNSIYNNDSGFTHDYYSGTTAAADNPQQCLGITAAAWKTGGPVTKTGGTPAPPPWVPPTTLNAPTDLELVSLVGNRVTVSWSAPVDSIRPTGYVLEGGVSPGSVMGSVPILSTINAFTFVAPTGSFYIRLHALSGALKSDASDEIRIFVSVPSPPTAPRNLLGLADGSSLYLAWHNGAGPAPVAMALDVTGTITTSLTLPRAESFSFSDVPAGTYTVAVRAVDAAGRRSDASNSVTLTFPGTCAAPAPPTQLALTASGRVIQALWSLPPGGTAPAAYRLHVTGAYVGTIDVPGRSISGAVDPGTYSISVVAINPCGASAPTPPKTITVQ